MKMRCRGQSRVWQSPIRSRGWSVGYRLSRLRMPLGLVQSHAHHCAAPFAGSRARSTNRRIPRFPRFAGDKRSLSEQLHGMAPRIQLLYGPCRVCPAIRVCSHKPASIADGYVSKAAVASSLAGVPSSRNSFAVGSAGTGNGRLLIGVLGTEGGEPYMVILRSYRMGFELRPRSFGSQLGRIHRARA
jgi:hypothetical protein